MVKQSTAQLLSLQNLISRHTGKRLAAHKIKQLTHENLSLYFDDASALFSAQQSLRLWKQLKKHIIEIENFVLAQCKKMTSLY